MNPFTDLIPKNNIQAPTVSKTNPFADLTPTGTSSFPASAAPAAPEKKSGVGELIKSVVSAPATIVARPFQAVQAGAQYLNDKPALDKYIADTDALTAEGDALLAQYKAARAAGQDTTELKKRIQDLNARTLEAGKAAEPLVNKRAFSGGIIAPTPENMKDVKKDVGRAIETVALGTAAPLAGGAAFGVGSSLEQGNDLFSAQTLVDTALGAAGGKVLDWVGKPLFNGAGKVIGTITPKILKDVAAKGAGALQKFAADNQLLGGVAGPLSERIATGLQKVDEKAGLLFKGGGKGLRQVIASQYPGVSKESIIKHYQNVEMNNFKKPTEVPAASYRKATEIFKNAKDQGTDLSQVALNNGIRHDSIVDGGKYSTIDVADQIRSDAMKTSHDLIRPALEAAEPGVQRVPIADIRNAMIAKIDSIPPTQLTDAERALMKERIAKQYADDSAAAKAHPEGYSLTDLHDNSIAANLNGKYRPNGTAADNFRANQSRQEGAVFRDILGKTAPEDIQIDAFKKELQKQFQLADYLEALNGKKVPQGIVAKAIDLFGKVTGASVGARIGGGLGGVAGYHFGGVLFDAFEHLPNPVKAKYLNMVAKEAPEVFKAFQEYLGKAETERLMRKALPAPTTIFKGPTQNGLPFTPNPVGGQTTPVVETKRIFGTGQ